MAWWAAVLSDTKSVGGYGPWRPYKNNNKNSKRNQSKKFT